MAAGSQQTGMLRGAAAHMVGSLKLIQSASCNQTHAPNYSLAFVVLRILKNI